MKTLMKTVTVLSYWLNYLKGEIENIHQNDPSMYSKLDVIFLHPGFHIILFHNTAHFFWIHGFRFLGRFISNIGRFCTGIEIHPNAKIGKNFFVDHGHGVVIGETSVIGNDCTLFQGVTLGGKSNLKGRRLNEGGRSVRVLRTGKRWGVLGMKRHSSTADREKNCECSKGENKSLELGRIGLGTWAWGNRLLWGYETEMDDEIQKALHRSIDGGVRLIDTADSYGTGDLNGRAELLLGRGLKNYHDASVSETVVVATKLAPYPWRLTRGSIVSAAKQSLDRLGKSRKQIDIGQLHWSTANYAPWQERQLWDGIADCYECGLIRSVGLSNYGPQQLQKAVKFIREERQVPVSLAQAQGMSC